MAEELLARSHGMSVVVDVRRKFGDSLDNFCDAHIAPAERVRLQTYPVGMIDIAGKSNADAKHPLPGDFWNSNQLIDPSFDRGCDCPGLLGIPHSMLGQGISV